MSEIEDLMKLQAESSKQHIAQIKELADQQKETMALHEEEMKRTRANARLEIERVVTVKER